MLGKGARNEKVSIKGQPNHGAIEANGVWCACG